jgi:hypothetical protein
MLRVLWKLLLHVLLHLLLHLHDWKLYHRMLKETLLSSPIFGTRKCCQSGAVQLGLLRSSGQDFPGVSPNPDLRLQLIRKSFTVDFAQAASPDTQF